MRANTRTQRFSERTIQQVRVDCDRAMTRAKFCTDRSDVIQLRCIDDRPETDLEFGNQLWFFDGLGVDTLGHRHNVFGVVEYSLQFGLNELVEDGVFDSEQQRERFRALYNREVQGPTWRHAANRWLIGAIFACALFYFAYYWLFRLITA
jgi:hypothetical protein